MTRVRLYFLSCAFFLGFGLVLFRAFKLQLFPNQRVERLFHRQTLQKIEIVGRRGAVVDRNGRELAVSTNSLSVFVNPRLVKEPRKVARVLSPILGRSEKSIASKIREASGRRFIWLERQLSSEQMAKLEKVDLKSLVGVDVLPEYRRVYPFGELASHVLGFVGIDGGGLAGVERKFDSELRGHRNTVNLERDRWGRPVFSHREQIRFELNSGSGVELTLDSNLQHSVERALKEAVDFHQADGGTAIVMDPSNGEILALANTPGFDPNHASEFPAAARRNRAITDPIEPGSVMKPFVVARALEDGIVTPSTMIPAGNGSIKVGRKVIHEAEANHRFAKLSIVDLIRISSNVATVMLKNRMGFDRIADTYTKLGFGAQTGVELGGESRGIFVKPRPEQLLEQATMAFGQGISLTPLQIAAAYAALANGGYRIRPHLVRRVGDKEKDSLALDMPIEARTRVFSEHTSAQMRSILEKVVEGEGTGVLAKVEGFRVAGKTGTAQKVDYANGGYQRGSYWASFAGFIPSEKPKYVIYVMIDHPTKNGVYGGSTAAPVFAKIAQAAVRLVPSSFLAAKTLAANREAQPFLPVTKSRLKRSSSESSSSRASTLHDKMPDLTGMPVSYALRVLKHHGYRMELQGSGDHVVEQLPSAGSTASSDTTVYLKLR